MRKGGNFVKTYEKYSSGIFPIILFTVTYFSVVFLYFYLILNSIMLCAVITSVIYPYAFFAFRKYMTVQKIKKLEIQFGEALRFISSSVAAGVTVENSFYEFASKANTYNKSDLSLIAKEFRIITNSMDLHENAADAFRDFAERSGSSDIKIFSLALSQIYSSGGDIVGLLRNTVSSLRIKRETEDEISLILAGPKYNHRIITVMPVLIIFLMKFISPDYMSAVYEGPGRIVGVISAILIVVAYIIGSRLSDIQM
ncbi:MAG: type II secretion system F family protein [Clostridia bacterium]|nr:type II secretion system F family protein [Clostridia bacterium]MBQ8165091.1 type II secretion system F family protein [Clostridia bacterium]